MLTIKAEATAGSDLGNDVLPQMLALAVRTGCRVEVEGNDTTFWVDPDDTLEGLAGAFSRLYPASRYVASWIVRPMARTKFQGE